MSADPIIFQSETTAIAQCKYGPMMYLKSDLYIGRSLEVYGEWHDPEVQLLTPLLAAGDIAVDVGANIGTHTIPLAKAVGAAGYVVAFEAQRLIHGVLSANVLLNDLENVRCLNMAAGAAPGAVQIPVLDVRSVQNFGGVNIRQFNAGDNIPVIPIDSLNLDRCKLIKIDVEGMEADVLHGAKQTILRHRPFLFVENNREETALSINAVLHELGYQCWWFFCRSFRPDNFRGVSEDIFKDVYVESNLFCVPREANATVHHMEPLAGTDDTWRRAFERVVAKSQPPNI